MYEKTHTSGRDRFSRLIPTVPEGGEEFQRIAGFQACGPTFLKDDEALRARSAFRQIQTHPWHFGEALRRAETRAAGQLDFSPFCLV